jgi:glyoxylase-like metal-dependent hydrolase (beta-lactamase superfamily II)
MKQETKVRKMFVLDGGSFLYETAMMVFGRVGAETHQRVFTPMYAFETEEGWVLYDTGWPPEAIPMLVDLGMDPKIGDENSAVGQLKKIGVSPSDVTKIILSHLHVDHAGGLQFFPAARVYVQKDELAYALYPNSFQALAYARETFILPDIKWEVMEGDGVILPGLTTVLANGHTPGLQGLVVELPKSGFILLCADACYLRENYEQNLPPGNVWNPVLAQYALKRYHALLAILGARFFPGHEYDFFTREIDIAKPFE